MTDLNIHFSGGARSKLSSSLDGLILPGERADYRAAETHFSVHANPDKETNTITRRLSFRDADEETESGSVLVTTGIKAGLFSPLLFRICGNLSSDRFDVRSDVDDIVNLGTFNPLHDQLRFLLAVAKVGTHFRWDTEHPSNLMQRPFEHYELVVIWSYFNFPAQPHAINLVPYSVKKEGPVGGLEWWEVYNLFTDMNQAYSDRYFDTFSD
jgi:hypothetical protein